VGYETRGPQDPVAVGETASRPSGIATTTPYLERLDYMALSFLSAGCNMTGLNTGTHEENDYRALRCLERGTAVEFEHRIFVNAILSIPLVYG
jgi:hypothetical protein